MPGLGFVAQICPGEAEAFHRVRAAEDLAAALLHRAARALEKGNFDLLHPLHFPLLNAFWALVMHKGWEERPEPGFGPALQKAAKAFADALEAYLRPMNQEEKKRHRNHVQEALTSYPDIFIAAMEAARGDDETDRKLRKVLAGLRPKRDEVPGMGVTGMLPFLYLSNREPGKTTKHLAPFLEYLQEKAGERSKEALLHALTRLSDEAQQGLPDEVAQEVRRLREKVAEHRGLTHTTMFTAGAAHLMDLESLLQRLREAEEAFEKVLQADPEDLDQALMDVPAPLPPQYTTLYLLRKYAEALRDKPEDWRQAFQSILAFLDGANAGALAVAAPELGWTLSDEVQVMAEGVSTQTARALLQDMKVKTLADLMRWMDVQHSDEILAQAASSWERRFRQMKERYRELQYLDTEDRQELDELVYVAQLLALVLEVGEEAPAGVLPALQEFVAWYEEVQRGQPQPTNIFAGTFLAPLGTLRDVIDPDTRDAVARSPALQQALGPVLPAFLQAFWGLGHPGSTCFGGAKAANADEEPEWDW